MFFLGGGIAKLMHSMIEVRLLDSGRLCLVPLVPAIVPNVDLANRLITILPPDGLLDLTYEEKQRQKAIRGFLPDIVDIPIQLRRELEAVSVLLVQSCTVVPEDKSKNDKVQNSRKAAKFVNSSKADDDEDDEFDSNLEETAVAGSDEYELELQERELDRQRKYY